MLQEKAKMSLFIKKIGAFFWGGAGGSRGGRRIYSYVFRDLNLTYLSYNTLLSYVPCIIIMYAHD